VVRTKGARQWLGPAFETANRREGLLRQAPSPISIPFNRRVLQSPSGHFDAQSFGIQPDGSANHEFAFVTPVSLNLSADAVIKPQNAFVSQPLDFHANKLPRNATIKSPASTAALMAMKRPLEYVQRSPGSKFIASENSLLSPGVARLSKACLPWGVQRFCSLRGTKGTLQSGHTNRPRPHLRAVRLPPGEKARVQVIVRLEGSMFAAERLIDGSNREADLGSFDRDG
jgi:hypothetical protein